MSNRRMGSQKNGVTEEWGQVLLFVVLQFSK